MEDKFETPCWLTGGELIGTVVNIWEFVVAVVDDDDDDEGDDDDDGVEMAVFSAWIMGEFGWLPFLETN